MEKGYRTIFWGLFFSTFHINFGIQILPPFIGWIMVAVGIAHLNNVYPLESFQKSKSFATIAAIIASLEAIIPYTLDLTSEKYLFLTYHPILFAIFELLMFYYLLEGSVHYLRSVGNKILAIEFEEKLLKFIIIFVINTILESIVFTIQDETLGLVVIVIGIGLIIWLLNMMHRLKLASPEKLDAIDY